MTDELEGEFEVLADEEGEFEVLADEEHVTQYKNRVVFLRKSKKGEHLYAFDNDGAFAKANSILMNISDVKALIEGKFESVKVSIMEKEEVDLGAV